MRKFIMFSLKRGMLLSAAIPMLVALVFSVMLTISQLQEYRQASQAEDMKGLIEVMSALIHEQQKERGATSVFLSSQGEQFGNELDAQRDLTNRATGSLFAVMEELASSTPPEISARLSEISVTLSKRAEIRRSVDDLAIPTPEALQHYTASNAEMLNTIASIGALSENPRITNHVASLEAILSAKEFAGIERAVGSGGFAIGSFSIERIRTLERLVGLQATNLSRFENFAEPEFKADAQAIANMQETAAVQQMREVAFSSFETGDLQGIAASDFFVATTVRIDAFKVIEDRLVETIGEAAADVASTSLSVVIAILLSILLAIAASVAATTYVIKQMLKAVRRISDASDELARGQEDAQLPKDSPKELGRIVWSIDFFRESVIAAKERDAKNTEERDAAEKVARDERETRQREETMRVEREASEARAEQERMNSYVAEISKLVSSCAKGDFTKQIPIDGKDGVLAEIGEGLNRLVQSVDQGLSATGRALARVASGDLTTELEGDFQGAFKDLQDNTNSMIGSLKALVGDINGSAVNLSSSSNELRDTSNALSKQAEQNAASLEETSAALEELSVNISQVNENVTEANKNASDASATAKASSTVASDAAEAMNRISEASKEIASVVTVINDISFQINLLALNAGVEAARAGDTGRGFSVVASEVRNLAQRAVEAAKEIDEVIGRSNVAVNEGVAKVQSAQQSFEEISTSVVGVSERIDHISKAISEQVSGIGEISNAIAQIDNNTQKQAASFEEVTAASGVLSNEADGLKQSTSSFNTGSQANTTSARAAPKPRQNVPNPVVAPAAGNLAEDLDNWSEF